MIIYQLEELKQPTIELGSFKYKNLTIEGIILTQYARSCATGEIVSSLKHLCTEKAIALSLNCSETRLHKAMVRVNSLEKPKNINRLEDALGGFEVGHDRLCFKGLVYNPLYLYREAIKDLAFRRPYLNAARMFYLEDGGRNNSHFGRLGLVK